MVKPVESDPLRCGLALAGPDEAGSAARRRCGRFTRWQPPFQALDGHLPTLARGFARQPQLARLDPERHSHLTTARPVVARVRSTRGALS